MLVIPELGRRGKGMLRLASHLSLLSEFQIQLEILFQTNEVETRGGSVGEGFATQA